MALTVWDQNPLPEMLKANHVDYLLLALDGDLAFDQWVIHRSGGKFASWLNG